jgi:hypothetical protein
VNYLELSGNHFEYGGKSSRDFGLVFGHVETTRVAELSGELDISTNFNRRTNSNQLIKYNYESSPLSLEVELVSDDCEPIPLDTQNEIIKWMFNRKTYRKLYIDTDDADRSCYDIIDGTTYRHYLNCIFINPIKIEDGSGQVLGYRATIKCDSHLAWQDPVVVEIATPTASLETSCNAEITIDTDTDEYIYPIVTINVGSTGGVIKLVNYSDDENRVTGFINATPLSSIVMKGDLNYVSGQNYERFSNRNFIRLINGVNSIYVFGDVTSIKFEYQSRRYL